MSAESPDLLVSRLDGLQIGRMGINKCTAVNDVWLTVYDASRNGIGDEQLSFGPAELLAFCREVIRIATGGGDAHENS